MAELTQDEIDAQKLAEQRAFEELRESNRREYERLRELDRLNHDLILENKRARLEVVRLAKETLIENNRSKSIDERDISADDIKNFANVLYNYVAN